MVSIYPGGGCCVYGFQAIIDDGINPISVEEQDLQSWLPQNGLLNRREDYTRYPNNMPAPIPLGEHEIRPNPQDLTGSSNSAENSSTGVNYEPDPSQSLTVAPDRDEIVRKITSLYSGSASEEDMKVYAEEAIYDDPWSFCDTRYKIAGQWYGIPKVMASSRTLATQIISSTPNELVFKMTQEYTPRVVHFSKPVNSLITLTLDEQGKVKYHKDMWNDKDYSHEGIGKIMKTLNGDYLTKITQPPGNL